MSADVDAAREALLAVEMVAMTRREYRAALDAFEVVIRTEAVEQVAERIAAECARLIDAIRAEAGTLDVERLAEALHEVYCHQNRRMHSAPDHSAQRIAVEYARLAKDAER